MKDPQLIQTQSSCADIFEPGLLHFDTARARILDGVRAIAGFEQLGIEQACRRTLDEDVMAPFNVPRHANSALDGYALRGADLPAAGAAASLPIAGSALAGRPYGGSVAVGQCVRIMTGALMPDVLDTVVMQEHVERRGEAIVIDGRYQAGQNVRAAGEDMREGETVLRRGHFLLPADIGLLASLGIAEVKVKRKLRVAIASTGDELCNVGSLPAAGGIYDSNRYSLLAALTRADVEVIDLGILEDRPETLLQAFNQAGEFADVIVSSGGVSVGEADYTKAALQASGHIAFWKVALKPGRPLAFGTIGQAVFFGLPGNPVAVLVTYSQFVLPALEKMLGITDKPQTPIFKARALQRMRKKPGRTEFLRGIVACDSNGDWTVKTTGPQGSGILRSMSLANALIILRHERGDVESGEWVEVQLLPHAG
ncbi:MAG: molybdopterin molybdotransferase MoeA [Gammaproteobacteria bacterium]